jgi:hypothetical protein
VARIRSRVRLTRQALGTMLIPLPRPLEATRVPLP